MYFIVQDPFNLSLSLTQCKFFDFFHFFLECVEHHVSPMRNVTGLFDPEEHNTTLKIRRKRIHAHTQNEFYPACHNPKGLTQSRISYHYQNGPFNFFSSFKMCYDRGSRLTCLQTATHVINLMRVDIIMMNLLNRVNCVCVFIKFEARPL